MLILDSLLIGVLIITIKHKDQTNNLDKIWINKLKNGITMLNKRMQEDGDTHYWSDKLFLSFRDFDI